MANGKRALCLTMDDFYHKKSHYTVKRSARLPFAVNRSNYFKFQTAPIPKLILLSGLY
jgi:hypothetical protein